MRRPWLIRLVAVASISGAALGMSVGAAAEPPATQRGQDLFDGKLALTARLTGHTNALPFAVAVCANCHAQGTRNAPATASAGASAAFGPELTADSLRKATRRRGGPPSRYDEASFCKALTTGIDPADVIIRRTMPRYDLSAEDCHALWIYVSGRAP